MNEPTKKEKEEALRTNITVSIVAFVIMILFLLSAIVVLIFTL